MLKLPKSRGYVLLEALIGLMVLTVIVSLISFMMGQLYHRQQLKGCFLDAAATQLMDLQASATYPATVEKLSKEEQNKMKKVTFEKVNTTASPTVDELLNQKYIDKNQLDAYNKADKTAVENN